MTTWIVKFGTPRDISDPGRDGREVRFPFEMIEEKHSGTPRQSVNTTHKRIDVQASGSLIATWGLADHDLVKVLFQIAKEHVEALLESGESILDEIKLQINMSCCQDVVPMNISPSMSE